MNNDPHISAHNAAVVSQDEIMSALFAQMVMQQSSLAMMLLGKTPHPESGETIRDIEGARLFIDQLEMIEMKTKGNLSKEEAALLKQSLMALRMAKPWTIRRQSRKIRRSTPHRPRLPFHPAGRIRRVQPPPLLQSRKITARNSPRSIEPQRGHSWSNATSF
jgi:Domain of unknown function (DUF1844)